MSDSLLAEVAAAYEIERGKPMPSKNHSITQMLLGAELVTLYRDKVTVMSELSLALNGQLYTPDISVYPKLAIDWVTDEIRMTEPPLLIIEILSPTQGMQELMTRFKEYFTAGVCSCWLVQPALRMISVFTPDMTPHIFSSGTVLDNAAGISVAMDKIF